MSTPEIQELAELSDNYNIDKSLISIFTLRRLVTFFRSRIFRGKRMKLILRARIAVLLYILAALSFVGYQSSQAVIVNGDAITIDFEDFESGTLLGYDDLNTNTHLQRYRSSNNSDLDPGQGFDLTINNPSNSKDAAALYDSNRSGGEDPDLEFDYKGGNQQGIKQGNVLIIQESFDGNDISNGELDLAYGKHQSDSKRAPDDEANGGMIKFSFESNISQFGFTFIDLDESNMTTSITFRDTNTNTTAKITFNEFEKSGLFDQTGVGAGQVVWGDRTANKVNPITVADLNNVLGKDFSSFNEVQFDLKGSGGISNVYYSTGTPVPEASTYIGGTGILLLIGFHFYRRRKQKAASVQA